MSNNDDSGGQSTDRVLNTSPDICIQGDDVSQELNNIVSIPDSNSAGGSMSGTSACRSERNGHLLENALDSESEEESTRKRKRDIEDTGRVSDTSDSESDIRDDANMHSWMETCKLWSRKAAIRNRSYSPIADRSVMDMESADVSVSNFTEGDKKKVTIGHICWIQKSPIYQAYQTTKIQAKDDAAEVFQVMNYISGKLTGDDKACYRRWWLTTATEYNHIELVNMMLASNSFDLNNTVKCHFICPLYIAIKKGDLSLVQAFLLAGAFVTASPLEQYQHLHETLRCRSQSVHDVLHNKLFHESVSAIDYACIVNQPEVLKLLVSHYNRKYPLRTLINPDFHQMKYRIWETEESLTKPLHSIVKLATKFFTRDLVRLPSFVQMTIDAGGSVHNINERGYTPLQFLISKIRCIALFAEEDTEHQGIIVDTVKVLLNASSNMNMESFKQRAHDPLTLLIESLVSKDCNLFEFKLCIPLTRIIRNHLQLINDVSRLLLLNGVDVTQMRFYSLIPLVAARILRDRSLIAMFGDDVYDEILDSLSSLFRLALLAGANHVTNDDWSKLIDEHCFIDSFIEIACYSSPPGRSEKLINMLLNAFSASNIKKLMNTLSERKCTMTYQFDLFFIRHSCEEMDNAIKYIERIGIPRRLDYMACRAITWMMSAIILESDTSVVLDIPHLDSYILLL